MSVPPKDILNYLDQKIWRANPSAGSSSWSNRGELSAPELGAWRQKLLNTPQDLRDPAEVAAFNKYWSEPAPGFNLRIGAANRPIETTPYKMPLISNEPLMPASADEMISHLSSAAAPSYGGFSSIKNPGNVGPQGVRSWSNILASQQPEFRDPAEVEAYNAQLQSPAMMGVAPQYPVPQQVPGFNMPAPAPEAAQMPSQLPQIPQAPEADPYGYMEKGLLGAADLEAKAARNAYNASRSIAQQEQAAIQGKIDAADAFAAESKRIADERDARVSDEVSKLNDLGKKAADGKVTPFWAKASTEQKIGAGLAMALGAFGSSFSKGPNYAMQIIDKAIDDDIRAQMANIDQNNKAFANQREYVSDIKGLYRDRMEQALALKSMAYDKVENQLLSIASKNKELMALPNFQMALANNQQNKIKTQAELAKMRADTMKAEREAAGPQGGSGALAALQAVPKEFQQEAYKELKTVTEYNKVQEDVIQAFKDSDKLSVSAMVPGYLGGKSEAYDAWLGKIAGAIVGKVPGIKSDQDFRAIVKPMLPSPTDTKAIADAKKLNMMGFLRSQSPSAPILESYGYKLSPNFESQSAGQQPQGDPSAQAKQAYQWAVDALRKNPKDPKAKEVFNRSKQMLGM